MKIGGYWSSSNPGGVFSDDYINEYYRESYQSWEIVDYEEEYGYWPADRRCGYIFYSYRSAIGNWGSLVADEDGYYGISGADTERRCNCPTKYGPYTPDDTTYRTNIYTAVCQDIIFISSSKHNGVWNNSSSAAWVRSHTCPKGWGNYYDFGAPVLRTKPYVECAQGYVHEPYQKPVYGYVTRYRDAYRNYYSTRCSRS